MKLLVYWPARRESVEECAKRGYRFLRAIAKIDPIYATWFDLGRSRKDALKRKLDFRGISRVAEILAKGVNRTDVGKKIIPDLGFRLGAWNGAKNEDDSVSLSISCGSYFERKTNSIILRVPGRFCTAAARSIPQELLVAAANAWDPQWGGIISHRAVMERDYGGNDPFVDWMTYVRGGTVDPADLPASARLMTLPERGILIVTQDDPVQIDDAESMANVRAVESALGVPHR